MGLLRYFTFDQLVNLKETYEPIIEKWLMKGDLLLIKATRKTGKSVLAQQMAYGVSCGQPLLDCFDVPRALPVAYLAGEGFYGNWGQRLNDMEKMWQVNHNNFHFFYSKILQMHERKVGKEILEQLKGTGIEFKLIIFDPLMFLCVGGGINDNIDMGMFFSNVEMIKDAFDATAIVVHHDSEKQYRTKDGDLVKSANTETSMGASIINSIITHSYTIEKYVKPDKQVCHKLTAANQRASWMVDKIDLFMVVPELDPMGRLGYTLDCNDSSLPYSILKDFIRGRGEVSDHKLYERPEINMAESTMYYHLKKLKEAGLIEKVKREGRGFHKWLGVAVSE